MELWSNAYFANHFSFQKLGILLVFASKCVQFLFASNILAVSLRLSYLLHVILLLFYSVAAFLPQPTGLTGIPKQIAISR